MYYEIYQSFNSIVWGPSYIQTQPTFFLNSWKTQIVLFDYFVGVGHQHHLLLLQWWGPDSSEDSLEEEDDGEDGGERGEEEETNTGHI